MLFRGFEEPISGTSEKISDCRALNLFETVRGSLIRSVDNRAILSCSKNLYIKRPNIWYSYEVWNSLDFGRNCVKNSDCRALSLLETGHLVIAFSKSSVFTLFSVPRVLKFKSSFIQRNENRALGKFQNPLVLKYDICPIIQEHRSVDFFSYI